MSERVRPFTLPVLERRPAPVAPVETAESGGMEALREGHRIARSIVTRATAQARDIQATAEERGLETGTRVEITSGVSQDDEIAADAEKMRKQKEEEQKKKDREKKAAPKSEKKAEPKTEKKDK